MHLKLENGESWDNPGSSRIEKALKRLEEADNSFLILERDTGGYMQVAGTESRGYHLEYRSASTEKQYQCSKNSLPFETASEILSDYAARNRRWHTSHQWEEMNVGNSGGILSLLLSPTVILAIAGIGVYWACLAYESQLERWLNVNLDGKEFYMLTLGIGMTIPYAIQELCRWNEIDWLGRVRMVSLLCVFLMMLWFSIATFLG